MSQNVKPCSSDSISCASKVMIKDSRNEAHMDVSNRCKKFPSYKNRSRIITFNDELFLQSRSSGAFFALINYFISHFIILVMNFTLKATRNLMQRYRQSKTVN